MTREERAEVSNALGFAAPASTDGVLKAVNALRCAERNRGDQTAIVRALGAAQALVKRLLDVEAETATVRSTIARLVVANQRGDDYGLSDLAFELERAEVDLKDDYDTADALARATEQEGLL